MCIGLLLRTVAYMKYISHNYNYNYPYTSSETETSRSPN